MRSSSVNSRLQRVLSGLHAPGAELSTVADATASPALALRKELVDAPQSGIRLLMAESAELEQTEQPFGRVIHLEVGQPDFRTPLHILEATSDAVLNTESMTHYIANAGIDRLRELVADRCLREAPDVPTTSENILVTPGAVMAMASAFAVGLEPGQEVLVPDPGWPNYSLSATVLSAIAVPYACPATNGWLPSLPAIKAAITPRTKMIVLCNPSNPTGAVLPENLLRSVLELAGQHGLFVLADEIYRDICYLEDGPPCSLLALAGKMGLAEHVLLLGGASKSYAMTGFRVGWLRGSPAVIDQGKKVQEAFTSCGVPFAQAGAIAALEADAEAWLAAGQLSPSVVAMVAGYKKRRDIAIATLSEYNMAPAATPEGAFYMLLPCTTDVMSGGERADSMAFCLSLLAERGVAVAPGGTFGEESEGFIRISLAAADKDIAEGLRRFSEYVLAREAAG